MTTDSKTVKLSNLEKAAEAGEIQESPAVLLTFWRTPSGVAGSVALIWALFSLVYYSVNVFSSYCYGYYCAERVACLSMIMLNMPLLYFSYGIVSATVRNQAALESEHLTKATNDLRILSRWRYYGLVYMLGQMLAIQNSELRYTINSLVFMVIWLILLEAVQFYLVELRRFMDLSTKNLGQGQLKLATINPFKVY